MNNGPARMSEATAVELEIEEPRYFLLPILATDPIPYLFDGSGNPVDADGAVIGPEADNAAVPAVIRCLQEKHRPR